MIDRRITYDDLKGLETILRTKGTDNRTAAKPIYEKKKYKKLNGNVFELPVSDEWWLIREEEEKENDDDKESRKKLKKEMLMASAPHPGESWLGLWENLDSQGIVPKGIKTLTDFKIWFHKQDLDVEMFSRGGLASLIRAKRR